MTGEGTAAVVPAIGVPSSVAAIRSLGRAGVDPIAVSDDSTAPSFSSKYCAESILAPAPSETMSGYADALLQLAARGDVRTILPLREADVYVLARNRREFAEHLDPVWPTFETLRNVQDRRTLLSIAEDLGVPTPETRLLTDWPGNEDRRVVKSRYSIIVDDGTDRARYPGVRVVDPESRPSVETVRNEMGHTPLLQEFVSNGGEYGYFALFDRGKPVATFQHRRIRSHSYGGGASVYRTAVDVPEIDRYGTDLLSTLEWHGPAMVEFRRDARDGTFRLMEVNPRFWGSLALSVHAGVDFPYYYYQLAGDDPPEGPPIGYDTNVACHKLRGELLYLYNVYRGEGDGERPPLGNEILTFFESLYRHPTFDYVDLDDPRPFLADIRNTIGSVRT